MSHELRPADVASRLLALRALVDPAAGLSPEEAARVRFARDVSKRLSELRDLLVLSDHLHRATPP